jgi:glycosyltransferase involved in cell wall biosynthesis
MKIGIVATHSWPIPHKSHGGDIVIVDLARSLAEMGHEVRLYAPEGTVCSRVEVMPMKCSWGKWPPGSEECERDCLEKHALALRAEDVVHDFSTTKIVAEMRRSEGLPVISTIMGGPWTGIGPPHNVVTWSRAHRDRVLRGATDYEGSSLPDTGPGGPQVRDAHVVYGGVDTDWYTSHGEKGCYFLWLNRWHPAKGPRQAIDVARETGIDLVMSGESPEDNFSDSNRQYSLEMMEYARGLSNVKFQWLPPDPEHHAAKRALYRQAVSLLYPVQFQEPFGLSQVEAMACGTPVLGMSLGSVPEVVEDLITGIVCKSSVGSMSAMTPLMSQLPSETCRSRAVARFDRRVMAKAYFKEYEMAVAGEVW